MRNLFAFLALLVFLFTACGNLSPRLLPSKPPTPVALQTLEISNPFEVQFGTDPTFEWENSCTTTPINMSPTLYLTAFHCVSDEAKKIVEIHLGNQPAFVWAVDPTDDLALVWSQAYEHKEGIDLALTGPSVGDLVHTYSFPLGLEQVQYFEGKISSLHTEVDHKLFMLWSMSNCQGSSGSAILNEHGEIVSVLQAGIGTPPCSTIQGGVVFEKLRAFLEPYTH